VTVAVVASNPLGHCSVEAYNIWMVADRVEDIEFLLMRAMVISREKGVGGTNTILAITQDARAAQPDSQKQQQQP
jgi:hypothetical protein